MQLQQNMAKSNTQSTEQYEMIAQDPLKHIITVIEKRVRNMDKRKVKLDGYRKLAAQGASLDPDQKAAVSKYNEVVGSLDFAKELIKTFSSLSVEVQKTKEQLKLKEDKLKKEEELKRSRFVSSCFLILQLLSSQDEVQEDFLKGENNAVEVERNELDVLMQFYDTCLKLTPQAGGNVLNEANGTSEHLNRLYDGSNVAVCGSTYADIKSIFNKIWECNYFEHFPDFTKADDKEEEEVEEANLEREETANLADAELGSDESENPVPTGMEFTSQNLPPMGEDATAGCEGLDVVDATPFVEPEYSKNNSKTEASFDQARNSDRNLIDTHLQQQNQASFMSFQFEDAPSDAAPPVENKQHRPVHTIEEVLADVQGEYNFLQDSMLDFDMQGVNTGSSYAVQTNPTNEMTNSDAQEASAQTNTPFNSGRDSIEIDNTYNNKQGSNLMPNDAPTPTHPSSNPTNNLYPASAYTDQEKAENYIANNNLEQQRLESQIKPPTDNLGMGQTTFGSNEQTFTQEIKSASAAQYASTLHSMEPYQQHQELNMIKPAPENTYSTSPFSSLHGNSQSPFEGALPGNAIPDPIPMPSSNPPIMAQSLNTPDPPTTHIPFPNDKMSGYRSYNSSGAPSSGSPSNAGIAPVQDDPTASFAALQEKQQQSTLLSSGDADHVSPSGGKQESTRSEDVIQEREPLKVTKEPMAPAIRVNTNKTSQPANQQLNRNHRPPPAIYQTSGQQQQPGYNRGNMMQRMPNQNMGGFYNNRGGNYRPAHNRSYGNFDSMGHPKHFGGPGGGYQQHPPQGSNIPPFNAQYNRQDNGMYGGGIPRRGGGGSNRGNKGYPARVNNVRSNNSGSSNYNRSRTFRPQNPEQTA